MLRNTFTAVFGLCLVGLTISASSTALAAEDGDEKCGPDNYILKFDGEAKRWRETSRKCKHAGDETSGRAYDGDEKCGPDYYILKYDGEFRRWRETARKCRR